jgi:hypothetical protein
LSDFEAIEKMKQCTAVSGSLQQCSAHAPPLQSPLALSRKIANAAARYEYVAQSRKYLKKL